MGPRPQTASSSRAVGLPGSPAQTGAAPLPHPFPDRQLRWVCRTHSSTATRQRPGQRLGLEEKDLAQWSALSHPMLSGLRQIPALSISCRPQQHISAASFAPALPRGQRQAARTRLSSPSARLPKQCQVSFSPSEWLSAWCLPSPTSGSLNREAGYYGDGLACGGNSA